MLDIHRILCPILVVYLINGNYADSYIAFISKFYCAMILPIVCLLLGAVLGQALLMCINASFYVPTYCSALHLSRYQKRAHCVEILTLAINVLQGAQS